MESLVSELHGFFLQYFRRLIPNLCRVRNLIEISRLPLDLIKSPDVPTEVYQADVLRAAVVLLHATVEDMLRYMAIVYLPESDEEVLNMIPLIGDDRSRRPEKFYLGRLARHKGKSVDALITESVASYFEQHNFNSTHEVMRLLTSVGIHTNTVEKFMPDLAGLMNRRHQIVHCADFDGGTSDRQAKPAPLEAVLVQRWENTVVDFASSLLGSIVQRDWVPRIRMAKRTVIEQESADKEGEPGEQD